MDRLGSKSRIDSASTFVEEKMGRCVVCGSSNRAEVARKRQKGKQAAGHCRANNNLFAIAGVVRAAQTRRETRDESKRDRGENRGSRVCRNVP